MSQRQAAKALGVSQEQVRRDLTPRVSEVTLGVIKAERRAQRELELAVKQQALPSKNRASPSPIQNSTRPMR
jgi:hypothetical protein